MWRMLSPRRIGWEIIAGLLLIPLFMAVHGSGATSEHHPSDHRQMAPHVHAPVPSAYAGQAPPPHLWHDAAARARGQALYIQHCLACHGKDGDGRGPAASDLPLKPTDFRDGAMMQQMTSDYWLWRVMEGGQSVEPYRSMGSSMPAWKEQLSAEDAWSILSYARGFVQSQHTGHHSHHP